MTEPLIAFREIPWEHPAPGVAQKVSSDGTKRLRLLRFADSFVEEDWCPKGHVGYVMSGEMHISFNGNLRKFQTGDGLWIEPGDESKHKVIMTKGKRVELILFESEI